jgi:hypothetical protein
VTISESQLISWSHQGSITLSSSTYNSISYALESNKDQIHASFEVYLQGSYRNSTNIFGNSDVDVVVEMTSTFYSNLTEEESHSLNLESASIGWTEFRESVLSILLSYYGAGNIDTSGSNSIKIKKASNRLNADVVVSSNYKYYEDLRVHANGITFYSLPNYDQIINYPKLHYENGISKNSSTRNLYKPIIRIFKNIKERIITDNSQYQEKFPSFFIENLLYNVPNNKYSGNFQSTTYNILDWLENNLSVDNSGNFICQSGMFYLFGPLTTQWNIQDALLFRDLAIGKWNN